MELARLAYRYGSRGFGGGGPAYGRSGLLLLTEADRRIEAFVEARSDDPVFGFVPSDFHLVYRVRISVPDAETTEQRWLVTVGRTGERWMVVNFAHIPG